jgi:putative endonuclease
MKPKPYYVYVLKCNDGTFYTGITVNINNRMRDHQRGVGSKYTRTRTPVGLAYVVKSPNRSEASRLECRIKRLSREEKEKLVGDAVNWIGS